jgi:aminoglycoside phosphotransferase (APT) family kinase protein
MSKIVPVRDAEGTARILEAWLCDRLPTSSVTVTGLTVPRAGFSNETILGNATWAPLANGSTRSEVAHSMDFVVRVQPTDHQLYLAPDALRQARTMTALAGHVAIPRVLLIEMDSTILGAPFFLMERVFGHIPGDVPSWHDRGWVVELSANARSRLHENAVRALVRLHAIDVSTGQFDFLGPDGTDKPIQGVVDQLARFHYWCKPVLRYGADVIDAAMQYVLEEVPDNDRRTIVWGDARVGNMIFSDGLDVAAMLDWEAASLGPAEIDVAWWVMFDEYLCEANGLQRLPGIPDRSATYARYEELAGSELRDVQYFEVLTGLQFALINSRMADLLISTGKTSESFAVELVTRVTSMTKRSLDRFG